MKTVKEYDAVEMMRSIRSKLQEKYAKDPTLRKKRLSEIRKKYRIRPRRKAYADQLTRTIKLIGSSWFLLQFLHP
jgi:hypothetical protein